MPITGLEDLEIEIENSLARTVEVRNESVKILFHMLVDNSPVGDPRGGATGALTSTPWKRPNAPFDYIGGNFKGSWKLAIDGYDQDYSEDDIDPTGNKTKQLANQKLRKLRRGFSIYINNPSPHAAALEFGLIDGSGPSIIGGYSDQAVGGVLANVVDEWDDIVAEVDAKYKSRGR